MESEFEAFTQHNVGTLVDRPPGANVLGGMWILSRKRDKHHRVVGHKARWVIFGNHQIYGYDFFDTYASVGRSDSMRSLLALGVANGWEILQFDVETAFLNGDMIDQVYCKQVKGFELPEFPDRILKLNRSLYRSCQGARRWQQKFEAVASRFGIHPTVTDPAVYYLRDSRGSLFVHLHVDDSLKFASSSALLSDFRKFMDNNFTVKWTANPSVYLGIEVEYDAKAGKASLSQASYIETVLDRFSMTNCNGQQTPLPSGLVLTAATEAEVVEAETLPYQQLLGCLQWISGSTRPDICHAVTCLSRFNARWSLQHWTAAKHVLQYLKQTLTHGLSFGGLAPGAAQLEVYSDADFSQCPETRKSVTGYLLRLNGGIVAWCSRRQPVVALSTSEAEYMAASDAARHLSWLSSFLFDVFAPPRPPTPFHVDSTSAIAVISQDSIARRSKHIDRRYHYIRGLYQSGFIEIVQVLTADMLADFLTKPLRCVLLRKALVDNNFKT